MYPVQIWFICMGFTAILGFVLGFLHGVHLIK